jgi:O-antigen ligase
VLDSYPSSRRPLTAKNDALKRVGDLCVAIGRGVMSFEVIFVLFIFAGLYKADPRLAWFPVDLTLLLFLVSVGLGGWIVVRRDLRFSKRSLFVCLGLVLFIGWMFVSLSWSPSRIYGPDKARNLSTLVLWAGMAPALIIAPDLMRFRRFVYAMIGFATLLSLDGTFGNLESGANYIASENYLGVGRAVGFATMMVLVLLSISRGFLTRLQLALLLALYGYVLLTGGGRGPLLAVVAGVLMLVAGSFHLKWGTVRVRLAASLAALAIVSFIMAVWAGPESRTFHRFTVLASQESGGTSAGQRLHYWKAAPGIIAKSPVVGQGVGGWPIAMGYSDNRRYPHNILIETTIEGGLIGLILLGTAILFGLRALLSRNVFDETPRLIVFVLFVNTLFNAMVSGDLSDNRLLFATIGFMAVAYVPRTAPAMTPGRSLRPVRPARPRTAP